MKNSISIPDESVTEIRPQVTQLSGFENAEELGKVIPESTGGSPGDAPYGFYKKGAKKGQPRSTPYESRAGQGKPQEPAPISSDPNMSDPRYRDAVAGMTSFGGAKIVQTGFDAGAVAMKDKSVSLDKDETKQWDDYFYVVGKKAKIDPTNNWCLMFYAIGLLCSHILKRAWVRDTGGLQKGFSKFFGLDSPEKTGK